MITLTNTVTGKKEIFKSINSDIVTLYVCGVTPYDDSHIGHGRVYVSFDILYRLFKVLGFNPVYCRNFTDIDDKLLKRAENELGDRQQYGQIATKYINRYHEDMQQLGCLSPDYEPRVTDHIPEIIDFIAQLIEAGHAYESDGDVYFSISSFPTYGKLSKHDINDLRAGERVDINEKKKDPLDFALWKSEDAGSFWNSPWGAGRPGWHIECSALAFRYLGKSIDIHAGGLDLVFPHHENEVAQSEALFEEPFARYWLHNGLVRVNQEKMSKSLGNFFLLRDVFRQFDPMVVRYYILTHHYRAPFEFSYDDMRAVEKSYKRLCRIFDQVKPATELTHKQILESSTVNKMVEFMFDDLNTPGMLGVLFDSLSVISSDMNELSAVKAFLQQTLGLSLVPIQEEVVALTPEIEKLLAEREAARAQKDWARADALRDQLHALGVNPEDKKA